MKLFESDDPRPFYDLVREDPHALRASFEALLDEDLPEQAYQRHLEQHTELVPREFVQNHGVHFDLVFRKLPFGTNYKSDFFYLSKSSDDWNCVFIELERPQAKFFKPKSNDLTAEFLAGLNQIDTWRGWFLNPANRQFFLDSTLADVRKPLGSNPAYMKYVLVIGRRSEYAGNDTRRQLVKAKEADDFKIITYDSLMEDLKRKYPLYIAARRNDYVDILSDELVGESMFAWMQPEQIRVGAALLDKIKTHRTNHFRTDGGKRSEVFRFVEDRLRVRNSPPEED
ncbi:MAG: DUF4263 domain-containing protein [Hyphomonadaceae bacterium]|nr:DUF4263 domain-containing protein [Hyphomonadaceae bacterium]